MEDNTKPCRSCGSAVRIVKSPGPARQVNAPAPKVERRVCTNPACRTNKPGPGRVVPHRA